MKKYLVVIFLTLVFINFFGLINISNTLLLLVVLVLALLGYNQNTKLIFAAPIFLMIGGLILSMISCKIFRGQDYGSSFKSLVNYLYILLYFSISYIKPSVRQMEKSFLFLILLFNFLYVVQFILLQKGIVFIKSAEGFDAAGEDARFRMIASGLTSLGLYFGLNKYLLLKKNLYLLVVLSSAVVLLIMGFRTMIFFSALFAVYLFYKLFGLKLKNFITLFAAGILCLCLLQIPVLKKKVDTMIEKNKEQNLSNDDYIRVVTFKYYMNDYFKNNWERILGSGPMFPGSIYNKQILKLQSSRGIYYQDWGLLGLSWMIGIISVLSMVWYSLKAFRLKVPPQYYYIGIWLLYLVVSSITTSEFYRLGNFVIQALALYTLENCIKETEKYENWYFNISPCS